MKATLVYPHQLSLARNSCANERYYLVEDPLFFSQYRFHRQKLMLHRASMQACRAQLIDAGRSVHYVEFHELGRTEDLFSILAREGVTDAMAIDPSDDWLQRRMVTGAKRFKINLHLDADENFLCPSEQFSRFAQRKNRLFFTEFYMEQRKRLGILIENDAPVGGKWSFDVENRKKIPKGTRIPTLTFPQQDRFASEAKHYVDSHFPNAWGPSSHLLYPWTREQSEQWLETFLRERFQSFGQFEDAMQQSETFLFHSVLTPMLNIGLLTPQQVLDQALLYYERAQGTANEVSLASAEGFIRQIMGWREYIHGVYQTMGRMQRTQNTWDHQRPLPHAFYDGTTGIGPVDQVIRRVLQHGYCHHIERLMIIGNFMFLCQIQPHDVYRWFMEMFVDAYDWVMVPNVYGMSQNADGGKITTKPYISGSSYVLRMSNFQRGPWCEIWDALYWRFIDLHRERFLKNPRLSMMVRQLDKMGSRVDAMHRTADDFLKSLR